MNNLRCIASTVQFLTFLSVAFLFFVFVYFAFPDGTTIIHVTVQQSDRASAVLVRPNDTVISFRRIDDNNDYVDTRKGKVDL